MKKIMKNVMTWLKQNSEQKKTKDTSTDYVKKENNKESNSNKEENKEDELIEKYQVPNTPFDIVKVKGMWYVMMGRYRLNENAYITKDGALEDALDMTWDRILQVITIVEKNYHQIKEQEVDNVKTVKQVVEEQGYLEREIGAR